MKPVVAVTMGDPGGIGPEVILKSFRKYTAKRITYLIIGSQHVFRFASERLKLPFDVRLITALERSQIQPGRLNFLDVTDEAEKFLRKAKRDRWNLSDGFEVGTVSKLNAALAYAALQVAAREAASGNIQGIVTGPLNKTAMQLINPQFSGHTEYLAKTARVKHYAMMFVSKRLCVTLVTIHVPLKRVSSLLNTFDIAVKIKLTHDFLRKRLDIAKPRIGVASLNPHGREFGTEEDRVIRPAIARVRRSGVEAIGPLPGDQIFFDAYEGRLDGVVAMYHDQGLAPFKMIAFRDGVNVTVGLPYLRTSPDHGTAFDIAYQNKADPASLRAAIALMEQLIR